MLLEKFKNHQQCEAKQFLNYSKIFKLLAVYTEILTTSSNEELLGVVMIYAEYNRNNTQTGMKVWTSISQFIKA